MKPTTDEIRYYHVSEKNDHSSTHSDTCWTWHRSCAIAMLCDEVDRLREHEVLMKAEVQAMAARLREAHARLKRHGIDTAEEALNDE